MAKKHKFKGNKKNTNTNDIAGWATVFVLTLIASVTPLIVCLRVIQLEGILAEVWRTNVNADLFSYYKMSFLLWGTLLVVLIY